MGLNFEFPVRETNSEQGNRFFFLENQNAFGKFQELQEKLNAVIGE